MVMERIRILDGTLRDGGYINNWEFGRKNISFIVRQLERTNTEIIELGFMRDEKYDPDRTVFSCMEDVCGLIQKKKNGVQYAVFIEMANYYPIEKLPKKEDTGVDIIRYGFWGRKLDEAYEYAKQVTNLGYDLFIQPTRAEQYTPEMFRDMVRRFAGLSPKAIYIVDTFGLLTKDDVEMYARIANNNMPREVALGYHAHNNMQQAFSNAVHLAEMEIDRPLMIDCSIFGIGRGAGNLCTEIWMRYLNEKRADLFYDVFPCYQVFDSCLKEIYKKTPWGYSMAYLLTAAYGCNPNYAKYFLDHNFPVAKMDALLRGLSEKERYIFSENVVKSMESHCGM